MKKTKQKEAYDVLWKMRENLVKFMIDEIVEKESVLTGKTGYEGALGFEYQEIDNKFMGRLASINTFLHNLSAPQTGPARRPTITNQVEVVVASPGELATEINASLKKHPSLKLVGTSMKEGEEGKLTVLLAFTSP